MLNRIAKRTSLRHLLIAGCALAATTATGCKTGTSMPGASLFGWNKSPSAETLAGQGPSTTYPAPPGSEYNPTAIASNAAGTGNTNSLGSDSSLGIYAGTPAGSTPAGANGFPTGNTMSAGYNAGSYGSTTTPNTPNYGGSAYGAGSSVANAPSYGTTPSYGATPSYGSTPSYGTTPANPATPTAPSYGNYANSGYGTGTSGSSSAGVNGYGATSNSQYQVADASQTPSYSPSYGTAPSYGSTPSYGTTPTYGTGAQTPPTGATTAGGYSLPAGTQTNPYAIPSGGASGAQMAGGYALPGGGTSSTGTGAVTPAGGATSGYRPGSTAGATSYPSTPYTTPSGSMLR